jgi:hypothetical protein
MEINFEMGVLNKIMELFPDTRFRLYSHEDKEQLLYAPIVGLIAFRMKNDSMSMMMRRTH